MKKINFTTLFLLLFLLIFKETPAKNKGNVTSPKSVSKKNNIIIRNGVVSKRISKGEGHDGISINKNGKLTLNGVIVQIYLKSPLYEVLVWPSFPENNRYQFLQPCHEECWHQYLLDRKTKTTTNPHICKYTPGNWMAYSNDGEHLFLHCCGYGQACAIHWIKTKTGEYSSGKECKMDDLTSVVSSISLLKNGQSVEVNFTKKIKFFHEEESKNKEIIPWKPGQ